MRKIFVGIIVLLLVAMGINFSVAAGPGDPITLSYVGSDTTTRGDWVGTYGDEAYILCGMPNGLGQPDTIGGTPILDGVWKVKNVADTSDGRALLKPSGDYRRAACYYKQPSPLGGSASFSTTLNNIPAGTYQLAMYFVDWDEDDVTGGHDGNPATNRDVLVDVTGEAQFQVSDYYNGVYVYKDVTVGTGGSLTITVSNNAGVGYPNPVMSGIFLDSSGGATSWTEDWGNQGDWIGVYGAEYYILCAMNGGSDIYGGALSGITYSTNAARTTWTSWMSTGGETKYPINRTQWTPPHDPSVDYYHPGWGTYWDKYGLLYPDSSKRQATCWWSDVPFGNRYPGGTQGSPSNPVVERGNEMKIDLTIPEGCWYLTFYLFDSSPYDNEPDRQETMVIKSQEGEILDEALVIGPGEPFTTGVYHTYFISGEEDMPISITLFNTMGDNVVISGIFLDPADCPSYPPCPNWEDVEYLGEDWETEGNWVGKYGHYAYILPKAPRAGWEYPIGTPNSQQPDPPYFDYYGGNGWPVEYTLSGPTTSTHADVRALETPDQTQRRASCYYTNGVMTISFSGVAEGSYQLALYLLDWDHGTIPPRVETTAVGTASYTTTSSFYNGMYVLFDVLVGTDGLITISINSEVSYNAVVSGIFLDELSTSVSGTSFSGTDTSTQGNWVGAYGDYSYLLCAMNNPSDVYWTSETGMTYTMTGGARHAWSGYMSDVDITHPTYAYNWRDITTDPRACWFTEDHLFEGYPEMADMVHREATCWDTHTDDEMFVTLSIPEGYFYLALYMLDFDRGPGTPHTARSENIYIYDDEGNLLAGPISVTDFYDPVYERFGVAGPIDLVIKVESTNPTANAVLSGIFLDQIQCTPTPPICKINGYKYFDANTNGVYDWFDWPLAGWEIMLFDEYGNWVATTYTGEDGSYVFENLMPGTYIVKEVMQPGWTAITPTEYTVVLDCYGGGGGGGGAPPSDGNDMLKGQTSIDLYAGQNIHVGSVSFMYNPETEILYITFNTEDCWYMTATHLYVGTEPPDKSAPGQFPYKHEDIYTQEDVYEIPIPLENVEDMLYIAAHAVVECGEQSETAWVNEEADPPGWIPFDKGWGGYFPYVPCYKVSAKTDLNFGNWAPVVTGPGGLTIGFWKTNIGKNLKIQKGKAKVPGSDIQGYLDDIPNEFFTDLTLEEAYEILSIPDSSSMDDKARAHILALLLTLHYVDGYGDTMIYLPDISTWDDPYLPYYGPMDYGIELIKKFHHKGYMTDDFGFMKLAKNLADALNNAEDGVYGWVEPL